MGSTTKHQETIEQLLLSGDEDNIELGFLLMKSNNICMKYLKDTLVVVCECFCDIIESHLRNMSLYDLIKYMHEETGIYLRGRPNTFFFQINLAIKFFPRLMYVDMDCPTMIPFNGKLHSELIDFCKDKGMKFSILPF